MDKDKARKKYIEILQYEKHDVIQTATNLAIKTLGQEEVLRLISEYAYDNMPDWDDLDINMADIQGGL